MPAPSAWGRTGLVDQTATLLPWFEAMLAEQNRLAGHVIIPPAVLRTAFTGNPPLDLQGENLRFSAGKIISNPAAAATDSGAEDYDAYPPLALIVSNSPADFPNVLLCRSNWSRPMGQQLYRSLVFPHKNRIATLSPAGWTALQTLITGAPDRPHRANPRHPFSCSSAPSEPPAPPPPSPISPNNRQPSNNKWQPCWNNLNQSRNRPGGADPRGNAGAQIAAQQHR